MKKTMNDKTPAKTAIIRSQFLPEFSFKWIRVLLIVSLFITGIIIILKPWYNAMRFDYQQTRMMSLWYENEGVSNSTVNSEQWIRTNAVLGDDAANQPWEENVNPHINPESIAGVVDGIITIDKIDLRAPIIGKYSIANLNISICSVIEENVMGQQGNYVLAGHKSRIYGRHFSRIDELSPGDIIIVENKSSAYEYRVTEIITVSPSDVWVMENDGEKKTLTLITCDYSTNPIGRLIVKAEL